MSYVLTINGTTFKAKKQSLNVSAIIGPQFDLLQCTVLGTLSDEADIKEENEIILTIDGTRRFGGYVAKVQRTKIGTKTWFTLRARDYTCLLETALVNQAFTTTSDASMLNTLFTTYLPAINATTFVVAGYTPDDIRFIFQTLLRAVQRLVQLSGFTMYVDYNKNFHYFPTFTTAAPFQISDTPDNVLTMPVANLRYTRSSVSLWNRVTVVGGFYWSSTNEVFVLPGNGDLVEIWLPYVMRGEGGVTGLPKVEVNDNNDASPNWVTQNVDFDFAGTLGGGTDVLHSRDEKLLRFDTAPLDLNKAVRVTGQFQAPILVRVRSQPSFDVYGRWMDGKIEDAAIKTIEEAMDRGKSKLLEVALGQETAQFTVFQEGLAPGQFIHITNVREGLDTDFIINRVDSHLVGSRWVYDVSVGAKIPGLVEMILAIKKQSDPDTIERTGEVLRELLQDADNTNVTEAIKAPRRGERYFCNSGTVSAHISDFEENTGFPYTFPIEFAQSIICGYFKAS